MFGIFILVLVVIAYFKVSWQEPPLNEIKKARQNITEAEILNSSVYAASLLNSAILHYDSAMKLWQIENENLFFNRNFEQVLRLAGLAKRDAGLAISNSRKASGNMKTVAQIQIQKVKAQLELYNSVYSNVPLNERQRKEMAKGKLLFEEGILAFRKSDFKLALHKVDSSETIFNEIALYSGQVLEEYFTQFETWEGWTEKTIHNSKKHKTRCIVVDKFARKCFLYKNGTLYESFDIELGPNWIGTKNYQGDKSTPEGVYKVEKMKSGNQTKYHKAFLLNYPNKEDEARFRLSMKNGGLHKNAKIGGLIEIHGHGGKGADWTDGCVALENTDMDRLFAACRIGSEITIVGSLNTLNDILNNSNE